MALAKAEMEAMAENFRSDLKLGSADALDPFKLSVEGVKLVPISKVSDFDRKTLKQLTEESASRWSAMSVPLDGKQEFWAVVYNDLHDIERQRVSVLEEIWHILQDHKLTKIVKLGNHHSRTFEAEEEHDAYYLAAASLAPADAIKVLVQTKQSTENTAQLYGVSKELIEYRIKRLGYWYQYKARKVELT